ncbi:MAG: GNAT family N-acetyltransferase [Candidatus Lambdaproteobacteria bacterium]|nr:GNAT family N-acetyltransferase [Candidatus Lambdaproteobacteria bacterium]
MIRSAASRSPADLLTWREEVRPGDPAAVEALCRATGFFSVDEVGISRELVEERLAQGLASGYLFLFAEQRGRVVGYTCYGPIPGTVGSYDLYWIVVDPKMQGRGLGKELVARTEAAVRAAGGRRVYIETASRPQYAPTQAFYLGCGYRQEAFLPDFYAPGDGKLIYGKAV